MAEQLTEDEVAMKENLTEEEFELYRFLKSYQFCSTEGLSRLVLETRTPPKKSLLKGIFHLS